MTTPEQDSITTNNGKPLVKAVAQGGRVHIELPEPMAYGIGWSGQRTWASVALTIEQADELANAVAEAQLVAMEQRVRAAALARAGTR